jgi:hypothetical protein
MQMLQFLLKLIQGMGMIILINMLKVHSPDGGKMVMPFESTHPGNDHLSQGIHSPDGGKMVVPFE